MNVAFWRYVRIIIDDVTARYRRTVMKATVLARGSWPAMLGTVTIGKVEVGVYADLSSSSPRYASDRPRRLRASTLRAPRTWATAWANRSGGDVLPSGGEDSRFEYPHMVDACRRARTDDASRRWALRADAFKETQVIYALLVVSVMLWCAVRNARRD
jgi:hypothetical protein